jgi:hypothetical protein
MNKALQSGWLIRPFVAGFEVTGDMDSLPEILMLVGWLQPSQRQNTIHILCVVKMVGRLRISQCQR